MARFQNLPDEILLKIFGHLTIRELYKRIALVCKQFLRLSRSPCIFKRLKLVYTSLNPSLDRQAINHNNFTLNVLRIHNSVQHLELKLWLDSEG